MDEQQLAEGLFEVLEDAIYAGEVDSSEGVPAWNDLARSLQNVRRYQDAQVLTANEGLVLRFDDGAEFQLTIVQSR